jgi:hypothetical protein
VNNLATAHRSANTRPILPLAMLTVFLPLAGPSFCQERALDATSKEAKNAAGFKEFTDRAQRYVNLHKTLSSSLSSLKPTDQPEKITAHQQQLARKIREARPHARRGDIFSEEAREAFRHVVRAEFSGPHGHGARTTIRQGEPLKAVHLQVNQPYPDGVPFTTVPPTLLLKFPKLPDQVAYRIVARDLILLDVEANLVIDRIPDIFPESIESQSN